MIGEMLVGTWIDTLKLMKLARGRYPTDAVAHRHRPKGFMASFGPGKKSLDGLITGPNDGPRESFGRWR